MKGNLIPIREQFPGNAAMIDLLIAEDSDFASLCEDHDDCVNALRYWAESKEPEAGTRVSEYRVLIEELREEIIQSLDAWKQR